MEPNRAPAKPPGIDPLPPFPPLPALASIREAFCVVDSDWRIVFFNALVPEDWAWWLRNVRAHASTVGWPEEQSPAA
jgi:hypothetical protein